MYFGLSAYVPLPFCETTNPLVWICQITIYKTPQTEFLFHGGAGGVKKFRFPLVSIIKYISFCLTNSFMFNENVHHFYIISNKINLIRHLLKNNFQLGCLTMLPFAVLWNSIICKLCQELKFKNTNWTDFTFKK